MFGHLINLLNSDNNGDWVLFSKRYICIIYDLMKNYNCDKNDKNLI